MRTSLVIALTLASASALAQGFPRVGARAQGLGGAYVALADDSTAVHWNPAGLALQGPSVLFLYGQDGSVRGDLSNRLETLHDLSPTSPDISERASDALQARQILTKIENEESRIGASEALGIFGSYRNYAFSAYRLSLASAQPTVDLIHVAPSDDPATGFTHNTSRLGLTRLDAQQYDLTLSGSLGDPRLVVGVTGRYMRATSQLYADSLFAFGRLTAHDVLDLAGKPSGRDSTHVSFDAGVLASPSPHLRLGVVGKWLNSPSFETVGGGEIKLDARWRTGAAIFVHPMLVLTADLDLNQADNLDGTAGRREFAGGAELRLVQGQLRLRGGASRDIDGNGHKPLRYAAGVGVASKGLIADAAVSSGTDDGALAFVFQVGFAGPAPRH